MALCPWSKKGCDTGIQNILQLLIQSNRLTIIMTHPPKSNIQLLASVATAMLRLQEDEEGGRNNNQGDDKENVTPEVIMVDWNDNTLGQYALSIAARSPFQGSKFSKHTTKSDSSNEISEFEYDSTSESSYADDSFYEKKGKAHDPGRGKKVAGNFHATTASPDRAIPYWMKRDWMPTVQRRNEQGVLLTQQKSPDDIRRELRRYMEQNAGTKKKTALLADLGVNSNSFRKFMDRSNYKDPWRAVENGTYWAAARYLEAERVDPNRANTSVAMEHTPKTLLPTGTTHKSSKRQCLPTSSSASSPVQDTNPGPQKRHKKSYRDGAIYLMEQIADIESDATEDRIYESRAYVIKQIRKFLEIPGVSKANFCANALQGVNRKALDKLLSSSPSAQAKGHFAYGRAWIFFEKKRIYEGKPKSMERRQFENNHPEGWTAGRTSTTCTPAATSRVVRRRRCTRM